MQARPAPREARIAESLTAEPRFTATKAGRPERPLQVKDLPDKDLANKTIRHCGL
jgi:hypothetical protein